MGRGDSSWQDRNHHRSKSRDGNKTSTGKAIHGKKSVGDSETTPPVGTSFGTEGYDDTKATTAAGPSSTPQVGESILNSGGTGANETYDSSKESKAAFITTKKRKRSLKINLSGIGGTGRNIV